MDCARNVKDGTLVVIDMQPTFEASQETWLIRNVCREIRKAKQKQLAIVIVRYKGGRLQEQHPDWHVDVRILGALGCYKKVAYVTKTRSDGSNQVIEAIENRSFSPSNLLIVGVNTDACVADTVNSLSEKLPDSRIWVIADACHTDHGNRRATGRYWISRRKNIKRLNIPRRRNVARAAS
jgi:hypothetical protein